MASQQLLARPDQCRGGPECQEARRDQCQADETDLIWIAGFEGAECQFFRQRPRLAVAFTLAGIRRPISGGNSMDLFDGGH